jgi:hypothetical protein
MRSAIVAQIEEKKHVIRSFSNSAWVREIGDQLCSDCALELRDPGKSFERNG